MSENVNLTPPVTPTQETGGVQAPVETGTTAAPGTQQAPAATPQQTPQDWEVRTDGSVRVLGREYPSINEALKSAAEAQRMIGRRQSPQAVQEFAQSVGLTSPPNPQQAQPQPMTQQQQTQLTQQVQQAAQSGVPGAVDNVYAQWGITDPRQVDFITALAQRVFQQQMAQVSPVLNNLVVQNQQAAAADAFSRGVQAAAQMGLNVAEQDVRNALKTVLEQRPQLAAQLMQDPRALEDMTFTLASSVNRRAMQAATGAAAATAEQRQQNIAAAQVAQPGARTAQMQQTELTGIDLWKQRRAAYQQAQGHGLFDPK